MTMVETVIIVILLTTMLLYEMYKSDPRALLHKPTDESPFFVDMFVPVREESDEDTSAGPWKSQKSKKKLKKKKIARQVTSAFDENSLNPIPDVIKGPSMLEITDCKIRYSQLMEIIATVKRFTDLKLNNDMDFLIDKRILEDANQMNNKWE